MNKMGDNFQSQAEEILANCENRRLAHHLWLKGFHEMVEGVYLDETSVLGYLEQIAFNFMPFTKLQSGNFLTQHQGLVGEGNLSSVHLPVDDNCHVLFYLVKINEFMQEFLYDSCPDCKLVGMPELPHIELRQSVDLSSSLDCENGSAIFYDNRLPIWKQSKELIAESYEAVGDLVNNARVPATNGYVE